VENPAEWKSFNDYYTRDFDTNMGALGATHTVLLNGDAYVKTSIALMGQDIYWRNDTLSPEKRAFAVNKEQYKENRVVLNSFLSKKFNRKLSLKTGITLTQMPYDLQRATLNDSTSISANGATQMMQSYVNLRIRPSEKLTFNVGLHALYFALNQTSGIEPRLGFKYQVTEKQSFSLAWGIHGRVLPLGNYFTRINGVEVNRDIDLIRAQHYVAGWDLLAGKSMRVHAEVYLQQMKDVPVAKDLASSWSILNTISGFTNRAMVNAGKGQNIGLDMSVEKSFEKGAFFLLSGSVSRSHYKDAASREHSTAFDSGISATFMGGKEWSFKNASVLQIGLKILYNGGQRITPLLPNQPVSRFSQEPLLDEANAFTEKVEAYFRPDLRIAFRKNNPKSAWSLALDIQNLMGRKNIDPLSREYNPDLNQWVFREQSGLTPVLSFQIDL
jgi:TonB dependent receptor